MSRLRGMSRQAEILVSQCSLTNELRSGGSVDRSSYFKETEMSISQRRPAWNCFHRLREAQHRPQVTIGDKLHLFGRWQPSPTLPPMALELVQQCKILV